MERTRLTKSRSSTYLRSLVSIKNYLKSTLNWAEDKKGNWKRLILVAALADLLVDEGDDLEEVRPLIHRLFRASLAIAKDQHFLELKDYLNIVDNDEKEIKNHIRRCDFCGRVVRKDRE